MDGATQQYERDTPDLDLCANCGHSKEEHMAWDGDELIMFHCSYDDPVCDCTEFVQKASEDKE